MQNYGTHVNRIDSQIHQTNTICNFAQHKRHMALLFSCVSKIELILETWSFLIFSKINQDFHWEWRILKNLKIDGSENVGKWELNEFDWILTGCQLWNDLGTFRFLIIPAVSRFRDKYKKLCSKSYENFSINLRF